MNRVTGWEDFVTLSHKCLRFGRWSPLHTLKDLIYLLTFIFHIVISCY